MKPASLKETKSTIRFSTELSQSKIPLLPRSAGAKLPVKDKIVIEGTINNFPFKIAHLEQDTKGGYGLKLTKALKDVIDTNATEVTIEITRVNEETETRVPADFRKALLAAPKAQALWEDITPLAHRDWIFWMITAKQTKTRESRIKKACSMLLSGKRRVCCFAGIPWIMKNE